MIAIGGKVFDAGDVEIDFLGNRPINVKNIEFSIKEDFETAYSLAKTPIGWSSGKEEYEGKIELGQDEIIAIRSAAQGSITRVKPFIMTVTVLNEDNLPMVITALCKFTTDGFKAGSGDKDLAQELELGVIKLDMNTVL